MDCHGHTCLLLYHSMLSQSDATSRPAGAVNREQQRACRMRSRLASRSCRSAILVRQTREGHRAGLLGQHWLKLLSKRAKQTPCPGRWLTQDTPAPSGMLLSGPINQAGQLCDQLQNKQEKGRCLLPPGAPLTWLAAWPAPPAAWPPPAR